MDTNKKPECKLTGTDGNVFAIVAGVGNALRKDGKGDLAKEFTAKAFSAGSYSEVLNLCGEYVEVS
jgi:hypothetical protein